MIISEYHRPTSLQEALTLLDRSDVETVPLGGGTVINGLPDHVPAAVVDLQGLGLDQIDVGADQIAFGAMVTLAQIAEFDQVPVILSDLARREVPNTLRNVATIGGTVAGADGESGLLAGLLAFAASVSITTGRGSSEMALEDLLADPATLRGGIITSVSVPTDGFAAYEGTARTPADTPIILVVGHSRMGSTRLVATGIGATPRIIDPGELEELAPDADFRGSTEYRRHLVAVLSGRVGEQLDGGE